ncbi:MAG: beta-mannosidase [Armatimonadota bacterium]
MASTSFSLDGTWRITGVDPATGAMLEIDGTVPGHVHPDLERNGHIADPFWRMQADDCQWVEKWNWRYERVLHLPNSFDRRWVELEFAGLDTFAEIILNGKSIGRTANMLIPHRFEVGEILLPGENIIAVQFTNIWSMIEGKRLDYGCAFDNPERLHIRRMQCTFHWDWVNRFVSYGIWQPVTLRSYKKACIRDLYVYTKSLTDEEAALALTLDTERRTDEPITALIEVIDPDGTVVWSDEQVVASDKISINAIINNPSIWWPAGYGSQPIYRLRVHLKSSSGEVVDRRETTFGIRTVAIEQIEDVPGSPEWDRTMKFRAELPEFDKNGDAPGSSFTLMVNGKRIFCRGGNWVPCDPWPSRVTPEHYDHLIKLARDANINCLRNWGGGIYEPSAYWDACDKYGILVCQDFIMACGQYPEDDPDFMDAMRIEIPAAIRMLRNHPSLVIWNGDNENGMGSNYDDPSYCGRKIAEEISGPACRELDPSRPFMPTSPYGGYPNNCATIGDCHMAYLPWDKKMLSGDLRDYKENIGRQIGRFMSESTTMGSPSMRSLLKFMTPEDIADPSSEMWYYHTKDNPYVDTRLYSGQMQLTEKLFGIAPDIETKVKHQEYVQYEWVRLVVESTRRSKWYCSGILFWMYNDCWPATGWSLVDYYGIPKAAWYAMKRVSKPVIASIELVDGVYKVWVCNDTLEDIEGSCSLTSQPWTGASVRLMTSSIHVPANSSQVVLEVPASDIKGLTPESILVCDLTTGNGDDRAWYYDGMPSQMTPPPAKLSVWHKKTKQGGRITISTDNFARVVTLNADTAFSDNYFDMLPGEERVITYDDNPSSEPLSHIDITCWNDASV